VLVEHARTLVGITDATHAEYGASGTPIVTLLACSLDGREIDLQLDPQSRLAALHGTTTVTESTTCTYGLAPAFASIARSEGMQTVAGDDTGEVRAVERREHPFFVATLYQPQLRSTPTNPHPVFVGLLEATRRRRAVS